MWWHSLNLFLAILPFVVLLVIAVPVAEVTKKRKGWTHKFFPDIRGVTWRQCGDHLPRDVPYKPYICDPDYLLNKTEVSILNRRMHQLAVGTGTHCVCQRRAQCKMDGNNGDVFTVGFVVAVAVVKKLRVTYDKPGPDQIHEFAAVFGNNTLSRWALGDCENSAIVVLWEEYKKVFIATGRLTKKYLTADENADILKDVQGLLKRSAYSDALEHIIEKIHQELKGDPEKPVDVGTLSLVIAVAVASLAVSVITGCVCAFRCCGNLFPQSKKSTENTKTVLTKRDSFKPDAFSRAAPMRRSMSRSPKLPHVPRSASGAVVDPQGTQVMLRYMRDHDTTMV